MWKYVWEWFIIWIRIKLWFLVVYMDTFSFAKSYANLHKPNVTTFTFTLNWSTKRSYKNDGMMKLYSICSVTPTKHRQFIHYASVWNSYSNCSDGITNIKRPKIKYTNPTWGGFDETQQNILKKRIMESCWVLRIMLWQWFDVTYYMFLDSRNEMADRCNEKVALCASA